MTLPASGAASPLSSTRRRSIYQVARCPDESTKSPCTTALSLITRRRSSRSLTVGEPTHRQEVTGGARRSHRGQDLLLAAGVKADPRHPGECRDRPAQARRLLRQPAPGVADRVQERPVTDSGPQRPVPGDLPDARELGGVRRPHRQLHPGLHPRLKQDRVGHRPQFQAVAALRRGDLGTCGEQIAERRALRARHVHHARDAPPGVVGQPGREVACVGHPQRAARGRGKHRAAPRDSNQPPGEPAHVLVRPNDQARPGDQVPARHRLLNRPLAASLELPVAECLDRARRVRRAVEHDRILGDGLVRLITVDGFGRDVGVVAHVAGEQLRGGRHMHGSDRGGVDDRVPFPLGQLKQILGAGAVTVQDLGTWPGVAAQPPRERRDVVATADRIVHDGTAEETGAPENKKSHVWVSCRAVSPGDDTFRQRLTSTRPTGLRSVRSPSRSRLSAGNVSRRREGRCRVDRCALFVDAGYVLADGAMAVHGTRHRESVSWNYAGLLQFLGSVARDRTGLPLLRCYWYEATVEGRPSSEHEALADLPGVKLRLGRMRPGRREGVESEIHRDLTTLARNGALQDALVVSAEEDLAQVIADVQDLGLRVTLVHITVDGNWTISRALRQECDDIVEIGEAHLRPYVELVVGAEPLHDDERQGVGTYPARALTNGHGPVGPLGHKQALPAGSSPAPPEIYTAPVIAEYQRTAQPAANGQLGAQQPAHPLGLAPPEPQARQPRRSRNAPPAQAEDTQQGGSIVP